MTTQKNKEILLKLLEAKTAEEVKAIVNSDPFFASCEWIPYGGRSNNVGTVDGQMREPDNALMEKVTNSIDAILMRRCYEEDIDPRDHNKAPKNVSDAVQKFFGGKEKLREKRSEFAKEWLRISAEGRRERPTLTIIDKGEGQQPNNIKDTILSLNRDIKERIPFVYGTYNQGGSSPLGYAGDPNSYDFNYLQLVLSRRAPSIKDKERTKNFDHFGFTLVRKRFDFAANKFTYEYFTEKGTREIFSFPGDKAVKFDDYDFTEGCLIKLYDYQLPQRGNIVFRGLNEFIEKKLPDSPLPIYLKELRDYKGGTDYTIYGLREKFIRRNHLLRESYPQKLPIDLGEVGKREIEVFIVKHKTQVSKEDLSAYLENPDKIFFIKDGLVLHTESAAWLRNECELVDLSAYFFGFIDISNINPPVAQMLHSGREKFKNNATTKLALDRLKIFLSNENFRAIDKEYARMSFGEEGSFKDETFRKQLMKDLEKQPEMRDLFEFGEDIPVKDTKHGQEPTPPYVGTYLPEKFDLVGSDPRDVEESSYCKITFDTGADEKLLERANDRGEYDWGKSEKFQIAFHSFKNGKLTFRVDANDTAKTEESEAMLFSLRVSSKNIEFSRAVTMTIKEKQRFVGQPFPTFFNPAKKILEIPVASNRKLRIATDVANDYFEREKSPGLISIDKNDDLNFGVPKLKDGILEIRADYLGEVIKEVKDITLTISDDAGHKFEIIVPVKIIQGDTEPYLNLPIPQPVEKKDWDNSTPPWDENAVARIPEWGELKKILINVDSRPFVEARQLITADRDAVKDLLFKQIYINTIWMFLEFKDLKINQANPLNGGYLDPRDEVFDKAIRATSRMTLQNIKKLLR